MQIHPDPDPGDNLKNMFLQDKLKVNKNKVIFTNLLLCSILDALSNETLAIHKYVC
jgi:hypothetical protein